VKLVSKNPRDETLREQIYECHQAFADGEDLSKWMPAKYGIPSKLNGRWHYIRWYVEKFIPTISAIMCNIDYFEEGVQPVPIEGLGFFLQGGEEVIRFIEAVSATTVIKSEFPKELYGHMSTKKALMMCIRPSNGTTEALVSPKVFELANSAWVIASNAAEEFPYGNYGERARLIASMLKRYDDDTYYSDVVGDKIFR